MSLFTEFNPGSRLEIRQIHNKSSAIEGKVYYGRAADGTVNKYRGTFEGRLKDETKLISTEGNTSDNKDRLDEVDQSILDLITEDERLESAKADKCFAIAMSIVLWIRLY